MNKYENDIITIRRGDKMKNMFHENKWQKIQKVKKKKTVVKNPEEKKEEVDKKEKK